jgi:dihydropteroate synthase
MTPLLDDPRHWRSLPIGLRTIVLGVVNVTPDSATGNVVGADPMRAVALGRLLVEAGADALDVGGESTRPGFTPVPEAEEIRRVVPAIRALALALSVPISVDTTKAEVAEAALEAGATIVNDVSGLHADGQRIIGVSVRHGAALIVGHWARSTWGTDLAEHDDPAAFVAERLATRAADALAAGIPREGVWLDPGLGFGIRPRTSLALVRGLDRIRALGHPIVVGPSRKGFIGRVLGVPASDDWEGAAALVSLAIANGAGIVRVHDVHRLARVVRMADAIQRRPARPPS